MLTIFDDFLAEQLSAPELRTIKSAAFFYWFDFLYFSQATNSTMAPINVATEANTLKKFPSLIPRIKKKNRCNEKGCKTNDIRLFSHCTLPPYNIFKFPIHHIKDAIIKAFCRKGKQRKNHADRQKRPTIFFGIIRYFLFFIFLPPSICRFRNKWRLLQPCNQHQLRIV